MKICRTCKAEKPLIMFYAAPRMRDGLQSQCKVCCKIERKKWSAKNRHLTRLYSAKYYAANHEKQNAASRKSMEKRRADPEIYALMKKWDKESKAKKPEKYREYCRKFAAAQRAANPEKFREYKAQWGRNNPGKNLAYWHVRHAAKLRAIPAWADLAKIDRIYARVAKLGKTVDHIVPLQSKIVCGLHCEFNLRPLSESRNKAKGNRHWPNMP